MTIETPTSLPAGLILITSPDIDREIVGHKFTPVFPRGSKINGREPYPEAYATILTQDGSIERNSFLARGAGKLQAKYEIMSNGITLTSGRHIGVLPRFILFYRDNVASLYMLDSDPNGDFRGDAKPRKVIRSELPLTSENPHDAR